MSSSESLWDDLVQKLTCKKCAKLFTNPKILTCLHLICAECLRQELDSRSFTSAIYNSNSKKFQCQDCKEIVAVPSKVEDLITDVSTVRMVEMLSKDAKPTCHVCAEGAAHAFCIECRKLLCKECLSAHRRAVVTKEHNISLLEDMRNCAGDIPTVVPELDEMCTAHPTKPLSLYCKWDGKLVCEECTTDRHAGHNCIQIDDALIYNEKRTLENILSGIEQQVEELTAAIDSIERKCLKVKSSKEENLHKLNETFDSIQTTLSQRRKQLQDDINEDGERREKYLQTQKSELLSLSYKLQSCNNFTKKKLHEGTKQDILSMKATMQERCSQLKAEKNRETLRPITKEQPELNFYGQEKILKFIKLLGTFVSPENCIMKSVKQRIPLNATNTFSVVLKDAGNNALTGISSQLDVQVQYYNMNRLTTSAKVQELSDGCYEVSYTPKIGGDHTVSVHAGGVPILGSPFHVSVALLRDVSKLHKRNCQLVTHYGGKKFERPVGICVGLNDEVVIVDALNREGIILDQNLSLIHTFGQGHGDDKLNNPVGVAVSHNAIAVSEDEEHVVKKFSLEGDYLSKLGSAGSEDGQFIRPQGLCFSSKGLLFVADRDNHRIQVFDEQDEFSYKFGNEGPGYVHNPCDISISKRDHVFVTDWSSESCIKMYYENGRFISKINCTGKPLAIAITPDDCIIVSDDAENKVVVHTFNPRKTFMFGEIGNKVGEFCYIQGIAVSSNGTIYVTESGNDRLQVIRP